MNSCIKLPLYRVNVDKYKLLWNFESYEIEDSEIELKLLSMFNDELLIL